MGGWKITSGRPFACALVRELRPSRVGSLFYKSQPGRVVDMAGRI